jgi:hypothetical protein
MGTDVVATLGLGSTILKGMGLKHGERRQRPRS